MKGLVIGEVLECSKHPDADKLSITKVSIGEAAPLQIVCGAPNVAAGQKVVAATVGTTIYPKNGGGIIMKVAKIRGVESYGMICAEDEIGLSDKHDGILVLPAATTVGMPAADYFKPYTDWVYEIGLTPNRMDAMSHLGIARDVATYIQHHQKKPTAVQFPYSTNFDIDNNSLPITVSIENTNACKRYSGVSIANITVAESPIWLKQRLKAIGLRPINNIVDITNYVLHETGQPLHAFDCDKIIGQSIIVKNQPEGTIFITLDEKERKLSKEDLMICNAKEGMCIGGVFGGLKSGVTSATKNIFLESAWFNPIDIRKTSFRHGLRTDAAMHFEKNVDISNCVKVLKRAALLIKELAGGSIASEIIDVYAEEKDKLPIQLSVDYLKKLSGKSYPLNTVKDILSSLGFKIVKESANDVWVVAPFSKPDVLLPADVVEEIMRVDGYDNISIPASIVITPSVNTEGYKHTYKEKTANHLAGAGFCEILTNSIANKAWYNEQELSTCVTMLNSLSTELNIMRPAMLESALQSVAHNLNRKNNNLLFFEFGKIYKREAAGQYNEQEHLLLLVTGETTSASWNKKAVQSDLYYLKGVVQSLLQLWGFSKAGYNEATHPKLQPALQLKMKDLELAIVGEVNKKALSIFDIKQPVWFADFNWTLVVNQLKQQQLVVKELPKLLPVQRDLAMVVAANTSYSQLEKMVEQTGIKRLQSMQLFDVFESEKLGVGKKSMAVNFTFLDEEKTLTDKEIDAMMQKIMGAMQKELNAEIRK
jgi:phenylalanyl-tRNA synthetase beta chain